MSYDCRLLGGMLVVCVLTACQSTPKTTDAQSAKEVFARFEYKHTHPKTTLTKAMARHLSDERYSVLSYYHQTRPMALSPLDEHSDTLLETIIKTEEHKSTASQYTNVYRTHDEYFAEDGLYLRYYDEKNGTLPQEGYDLSRSTGLENNIQYADKQVRGFAGRYRGCVTAISHDVDDLVRKNPAIDINHPSIKNRLNRLDVCLQRSNETYALLFENPTTYQALDLDYIKNCAGRYRQNLSHALDKNRTIARYEDDDYDVYETVYGNFAVCDAGFEMGYRLDPVYYTESSYTHARIEQIHQNRLCALQNGDEQNALSQAKQNYATDPKAYATAFYRYFECLDKAMLGSDGEREPVLPTSFDSAQAQYELYKEWLEFNDGNEDNEQADEPSWFDVYFAMKQENKKPSADLPSIFGINGRYGAMASDVLNLIKKTPNQALAKNLYQHNNTQLSIISHHQPKDKRVSSVLAMEFDAPTASQRFVVPFYADFKNEQFFGDVSPLFPVMAVLDPKNTPVFDDVPFAQFKLPQELAVVPLTVFYDALQTGYQQALVELAASNFSEVTLTTAPLSDEFGATQVIKLSLGSKEMGQVMGVMAKQLERDLSAFIDNNPTLFDDAKQEANEVNEKRQTKQLALKNFVKKWTLINQGYQTGDVASALQIIEGVLPIKVAQNHYYYLDNRGKLVAHVVQSEFSRTLTHTQDVQLMVARFNKPAFDRHPLKPQLLTQNTLPAKPFILNDWLSVAKKESQYKKLAQEARLQALQDDYEIGLTDASLVEAEKVEQAARLAVEEALAELAEEEALTNDNESKTDNDENKNDSDNTN